MFSNLPLTGVRVLAFTHIAAGPYCTLQLASLGAEVIKVESRTRVDAWRYRDRNRDPEGSRTFADHNKNTRSVTLNVKTAEGRAIVLNLVRDCDVVIDNYSAGVMQRLGLGYADLTTVRPDIIAVHMTGLGSEGPRSQYVTVGASMMAVSGMTHLWNHPGAGEPVGSQTSYPDYVVGGYAAFAIVSALAQRDEEGTGTEFDLTQFQVVQASLGPAVVATANGLADVKPLGNGNGIDSPRGCYQCEGGNDSWCVISVRTDEEWLGLVEAMGRPELANDTRFATAAGRLEHRVAIDAVVESWTLGLTAYAAFESCQAHGVPAGVVASGRDLAHDPQLRARGFLLEMEHARMGEILVPGPPIRIGPEPLPVWRLGPLMGEDNALVLGGLLGMPPEEIARLEAQGVVE